MSMFCQIRKIKYVLGVDQNLVISLCVPGVKGVENCWVGGMGSWGATHT